MSTRKTRHPPAQSPERGKRKGRALPEGAKRFLAADRLPRALTLQMVQTGLETASALVSVCASVLDTQTADSDRDAAIVLQRCVLETLERQRERIESLLKEGASS